MRKNTRLPLAATLYMLILFASQGIAVSQESSQLVDTGVIFSVEQLERSRADRLRAVQERRAATSLNAANTGSRGSRPSESTRHTNR
jgi:hypothetical protein